MKLNLTQFVLIEQDPEMIKAVEYIINETGHGEVSKTIKIQDSLIVLEENSITTRKKP